MRPNLVPVVDPVYSTMRNGQHLNPSAFAIPPAFTFGNLARNAVVGPGSSTSTRCSPRA